VQFNLSNYKFNFGFGLVDYPIDPTYGQVVTTLVTVKNSIDPTNNKISKTVKNQAY
jgi:hypothetical protein